jgi:hypothetical protein
MTSRPSTAAPILAVLAIVLVMLGAYVGGYFWLGEYDRWPDPLSNNWEVARTFPNHGWSATFQPAGKLEAWIRSVPVFVQSAEDRPIPALNP